MFYQLASFSIGIIWAYAAWAVAYQLFYALIGHWWRKKELKPAVAYHPVWVLIPAYREDGVIVEVARQALMQGYPADQYEVMVIADSLQESTVERLRQTGVQVLTVSYETSTKSKALNDALKSRALPAGAKRIVVILDADNVMAPDFLQRINALYARGAKAIQGQRAAKNADTTMAILDGLSESVNNHILCKGSAVLGLSARLAGSGMAFDEDLFRQIMPQVDAIGGFDKELELRITKAGIRIHYDHDAIVYDEKVRQAQHFSKQRSRWIAAQFYYARRFFPAALGLFFQKGNLDHLNKAAQMLLPPRLITPGVLVMLTVLCTLIGATGWGIAWGLVLAGNLLTFALAMPAYIWRKPYRRAFLRIPLVFLYALKSLLGLRKANKQFIHTPHGDQR
ncbi:MAG TPA: glycosyltransferase family 2 protein [Saprospiraceae bacterium]|nr:glycosyltransferase family 2 protein [Saprospiraceae bacterium]HMQ83118.1 glycosyltransferase family 2 protein [Saprospiraceae bacterium]